MPLYNHAIDQLSSPPEPPDYFAPVRYQPPQLPPPWHTPPRPPQSGVPRWLLVCGVLFLVGLGGCVGLVAWFWHTLSSSGIMPKVPAAVVLTGTPLAWRELDTCYSIGPFPDKLIVGNFDSDADDELLYLPDGDVGTKLYEISGSQIPLSGYANNRITDFIAWDYDHDGKSEIVRNDFGPAYAELQPVVMDANRQVLARLERVSPQVGQMWTGDVDGDGFTELLSIAPDNPSLVVMGKLGKIVGQLKLVQNIRAIGNLDGDKQQELIIPDSQDYNIWWVDGLNQQRQRLAAAAIETPLFAADLNADGRAEVIGHTHVDQQYVDGQPSYSQWAIWDPATGETTRTLRYEEPNGWEYYREPWFVSIDINADGHNELAWVPGGAEYGSELYIAKADGTLIYRERVGALIGALNVARAGGKQHLVLLTRRRLLVWP